MTFVREPKTVHLRRETTKRWHLREINAENDEDGEGSIEQERRGFHWYVERWVPDGRGSASRTEAEGIATTFGQSRDRILAFLRIPLSRVRYLKANVSTNVVLNASDVEPKPLKPKLTAIKKTSKAARARRAKTSATTDAWSKIRAFITPRKKGRKRR